MISPMDRGFLFGDGVYEVIPAIHGRWIGFERHIQRLENNLAAISIQLDYSVTRWREICSELLKGYENQPVAVYLHVSRGTDQKRTHHFPGEHVKPTVFAFAYATGESLPADRAVVSGVKAVSQMDVRWKHCHIKSTSLLGNVLHFQHGYAAGGYETILYNEQENLTEASSSNVFIVQNGVISTPPLDHQVLPGITRQLLIDILGKESGVEVRQRVISLAEVRQADEIWLTSSSKEICPVVELDGHPVGKGKVGRVWQQAKELFDQNKFEY